MFNDLTWIIVLAAVLYIITVVRDFLLKLAEVRYRTIAVQEQVIPEAILMLIPGAIKAKEGVVITIGDIDWWFCDGVIRYKNPNPFARKLWVEKSHDVVMDWITDYLLTVDNSVAVNTQPQQQQNNAVSTVHARTLSNAECKQAVHGHTVYSDAEQSVYTLPQKFDWSQIGQDEWSIVYK